MNEKLVSTIEEMEKEEKIKAIYKWHNITVLLNKIKSLIDETFEVVSSITTDGFMFKNESGQKIKVDKFGLIEFTTIELPSEFEEESKERFTKTNVMFNKLGYDLKG